MIRQRDPDGKHYFILIERLGKLSTVEITLGEVFSSR
jgi:hypothetical protein